LLATPQANAAHLKKLAETIVHNEKQSNTPTNLNES